MKTSSLIKPLSSSTPRVPTPPLSSCYVPRKQRERLLQRLHSLSYPAFARVMCLMLERCGYTPVRANGRRHKRSRTNTGGRDLYAFMGTDLAQCVTLIQIKQYERTVSRRFADELRGVMARTPAEQGLIVTLSRFSRVALAAAEAAGQAPIRLVDGIEVLELMARYRIGLKPGPWGWLRVDEAYFDMLEKRSRSTGGGVRQPEVQRKTQKTASH